MHKSKLPFCNIYVVTLSSFKTQVFYVFSKLELLIGINPSMCESVPSLLQEACGTYRPKWCFCGRSCQINWVTVYSDGSNQSCTYLLVHGTNRQHANSASKSCHPKCEKPRYERNKFTSIKISRTVCLIFQNCNFIVSWYYSATNTKIEIMEEMEIFYF